ncbi:MAG: hypothetical protein GXP17_11205 [Gammaproteobacteria bacterium]|nr:hypothetical protein [Gammaproteobacteria bacterium]
MKSMQKNSFPLVAAPVLLFLILGLIACSPSSEAPAGSTAEVDEIAKVSFSASFSGDGQAAKALIGSGVASIVIEVAALVNGTPGTSQILPELSPASPQASISLVPGDYVFTAKALDASDVEIATTKTAGTLLTGDNTVIMTFLNGEWTFQDAAGNNTPIELSNGRVLDGFSLSTYVFRGEAMPAKAADFSNFGNSRYAFDWTTSPVLPPSQMSGLQQYSQFSGGTAADANSSSIYGGNYNLTQQCNNYCVQKVGDTEIWFLGGEFEGYVDPFLPDEVLDPNIDIAQYATTTVVDGDTITGNLLELNVLSKSVNFVQVAAVSASKTIANGLPLGSAKGRLAALTSALNVASKAAQSSPNTAFEPLAVTYYQHAVCGPNGGDTGDWVFYDVFYDDGATVCYEGGYISTFTTPNLGQYSWGIEQTGSDEGECQMDREVSPYSCWDQNGDGIVDTGTYQLTYYLEYSEQLNVYIYPVIAKGVPAP